MDMSKKPTIIVLVILLLLVIGMFVFTYIKFNELDSKVTSSTLLFACEVNISKPL